MEGWIIIDPHVVIIDRRQSVSMFNPIPKSCLIHLDRLYLEVTTHGKVAITTFTKGDIWMLAFNDFAEAPGWYYAPSFISRKKIQ